MPIEVVEEEWKTARGGGGGGGVFANEILASYVL